MAATSKVLDPTALRHAFGAFVTGVTIITTLDDQGRPRGMTANSFTSVSLDPPLVLICVNGAAASYQAFAVQNFSPSIFYTKAKSRSPGFSRRNRRRSSVPSIIRWRAPARQ